MLLSWRECLRNLLCENPFDHLDVSPLCGYHASAKVTVILTPIQEWPACPQRLFLLALYYTTESLNPLLG